MLIGWRGDDSKRSVSVPLKKGLAHGVHAHYNLRIMSELAYRLSTQQRALARDQLFMDRSMDERARKRHFECAQRLAARLIAGAY